MLEEEKLIDTEALLVRLRASPPPLPGFSSARAVWVVLAIRLYWTCFAKLEHNLERALDLDLLRDRSSSHQTHFGAPLTRVCCRIFRLLRRSTGRSIDRCGLKVDSR